MMQNKIGYFLLASMLCLLSACAILESLGTVDGATTVDAKAARELLERKVAFVDLRGYDYIEGHVPGAVHLDWNKGFNQENLANIVGMDDEVAFYCYGYGCYRSREAASLAVAWGYTRVYHFPGGYREWKAKGYPVE